VELPADQKAEPVVSRNPAILYGLGNLVENAVDFASDAVTVAANWSEEEVAITVTDDGPGFAPDVINRVGEPYVTMRGKARGGDGAGGGLGLGFFIAKTLLERSGAALSLKNRAFPESGAIVTVRWPRSALELNVNPGGAAVSGASGVTRQSAALVSGGADN
jgi:two-component system sensor histidine kinase RegB